MSTRTTPVSGRALAWLAVPLVAVAIAAQQAPPDRTKMLRSPTVSATHIAFAYANNIWVVERAGRPGAAAHELPGPDLQPALLAGRPAGSPSAASTRATPTSTWCRPTGGEPKRLTWHPGADAVQGWTPDGKRILFASGRATWAPSGAPRFWTVPAEGGVEEPMALPRGYQGKISRRRQRASPTG